MDTETRIASHTSYYSLCMPSQLFAKASMLYALLAKRVISKCIVVYALLLNVQSSRHQNNSSKGRWCQYNTKIVRMLDDIIYC